MRNSLRLCIVAILMIANSCAIWAQENRQHAKQHESREQLADRQAKYIVNQLGLDNNTADRFTTTFKEYQKEIWAIAPAKKKKNGNSEEEAKAEMMRNFDRSQKLLDLRKKYYKEYCEYLTSTQVEKVFQIEKQMKTHFANQNKDKNVKKKRP